MGTLVFCAGDCGNILFRIVGCFNGIGICGIFKRAFHHEKNVIGALHQVFVFNLFLLYFGEEYNTNASGLVRSGTETLVEKSKELSEKVSKFSHGVNTFDEKAKNTDASGLVRDASGLVRDASGLVEVFFHNYFFYFLFFLLILLVCYSPLFFVFIL